MSRFSSMEFERLLRTMRDGAVYGMQTFTQALYYRYRRGKVDLEEALHYADSPGELPRAVRGIRATRDIESSDV